MKSFLVAALFLAACSSSSSPAAPTSGGTDAGPDSTFTGASCSAARAQLLGAVDSVSSGAVNILSNTNGVMTLYVDATAGGVDAEATSPFIFLHLADGTKAQDTDVTSISSTDWDLALKRPILYTNDDDGGPGLGGAILISKDFDAVTAADGASATFATEKFFDASCNANVDQTGAALTTFSTWYDYDASTHQLTPAAGTWLVHGGTGVLYKLQIVNYYTPATGGVRASDGGIYTLKVAAL